MVTYVEELWEKVLEQYGLFIELPRYDAQEKSLQGRIERIRGDARDAGYEAEVNPQDGSPEEQYQSWEEELMQYAYEILHNAREFCIFNDREGG